MNAQALLALAVNDALELAATSGPWIRADGPEGATFYRGGGITVCRFSVENQGFPPGSMGYDGCIVARGALVRFPRDVAKQVFDLIEETEKAGGTDAV